MFTRNWKILIKWLLFGKPTRWVSYLYIYIVKSLILDAHAPNPKLVFAQCIEARYNVANEDVVGAAPTGDASTTSEWSTILLPTRVPLMLEV